MGPIRKDLSPVEIRRFGLTTLGGFLFIGAVLWYLALKPRPGWIPADWSYQGHRRQLFSLALLLVGLSFAAICFASHRAGLRLYIVWMTVSQRIGAVMNVVVLTILYITIVPVFSLIRLKDPLRFRLKKTGTYWEPARPHEPTLERMARPF